MSKNLIKCDECNTAYDTINKVSPTMPCPICNKNTEHKLAAFSEIPTEEMNSIEEQIAICSKKAREIGEKLVTQLAELSTIRDKVDDLFVHLEDSEGDLDNGLVDITSGLELLDSAVRSLKLIK